MSEKPDAPVLLIDEMRSIQEDGLVDARCLLYQQFLDAGIPFEYLPKFEKMVEHAFMMGMETEADVLCFLFEQE